MKKVDCYYFFIIYKIKWKTYYQRNRDVILYRAKEYYNNNKKWLKEQARNKYSELSKEEKKYKERIWNK